MKMPTQNMLWMLVLLMLMLKNVLTICSLVKIWKLKFSRDIEAEVFVQTLSTRFGQDFEVDAQAIF